MLTIWRLNNAREGQSMTEAKCYFCEQKATLLCDGDNCDKPICKTHSQQLAVYLLCRNQGTYTIDVCGDCQKSKSHWRLRSDRVNRDRENIK